MATLEVTGLKKRFAGIVAVDGIDLNVADGELVAILGSSGSGKSTLMRMVAGLEQPTDGDVRINGQSVVGVPPRRRNVAMVFQNYALYPQMTVRGNIIFPLKARGIPKDTWQSKLDWAVSILGIERLLDRKPPHLSGGEKQRVALARALVRSPELFIFDEPLSALDAKVRNVARAELRDLQERTGTTTLYVTHDQLEALGLGHRVAVMDHGRIRQIGTPEELYARPVDLFVAGFIGNPPMNLIERGDKVLGVRPEHLSLKERTADISVGIDLPIRVQQLEYIGSEWLAYGVEDRDGGGRVVVRLPQDMGTAVKSGERYEFVAETRRVKVFDKASGALVE